MTSAPPQPFQFAATVEGELASKSNQRRLVRFGRRIASIKSAKALSYLERFLWTVRSAAPRQPYAGDVALWASVYYASRRPDLDVALLQDCIQRAGIIKNDRQVRELHAWGYLDAARPRVEFKLTAIAGDR